MRVKRGSLFSLDDAKNNDLIFVGSPAENLSLRDIPMSQQFAFQRLTSGPRKGDLAVANLHPLSGEPPYFFGSPPNVQLSEDYAVIALLKGLDPANTVLILAGILLSELKGSVVEAQPGALAPAELEEEGG